MVNDTLHFVAPVRSNVNRRVTKRMILSYVARLFEPLGLVGPVITFAKIMMQNLWAWKIGWDDSVAANVQSSWSSFRSQLTELESIIIPRLVLDINEKNEVALHGFSDASEQTYGACILYIW